MKKQIYTSVDAIETSSIAELVGYMRVSTDDQTHGMQEDALIAQGCSRIFSDTSGGAKADRPGLADALSYVRPGDTLVVWRLDRLGRSLKHLLKVVEELDQRKVELRSICESIDTASAGGRLVMQVFGAIAEFERSLIRERVSAGLVAARRRGRVGGRRKAICSAKANAIRAMRAEGLTTAEILAVTKISRATYFRHISSAKNPSADS